MKKVKQCKTEKKNLKSILISKIKEEWEEGGERWEDNREEGGNMEEKGKEEIEEEKK